MICTHCGASIPDGSKFCTSCGAALTGPASVPSTGVSASVSAPVCPNCGAPVESGAQFCTACGTALGNFSAPGVGVGGAAGAVPVQPAAATFATCPNCGAPLEPGAAFCTVCRYQVVEPSGFTQTFSAVQGGQLPPTVDPNPDMAAPGMGPNGPKKKMSGGAIAAIVILVIALVGGGGAAIWWFGFEQPAREAKEADEQAHSDHNVLISVSAPGWNTNTGASRLPVKVEGKDLDGKNVDEVQYVDSNGKGIVLKEGSYTLSVAGSPFAQDGTVYEENGTTIDVEFKNHENEEELDLTKNGGFELTAVDMADVTDDELNEIADLASKDPSKNAANANDLKQLATDKRDAAASQRQVEEQERKAEEAKRSRLVQADSYEFYIPEEWVGRVTVNVDGDDVTIYSKKYPRLSVCSLSYLRDDRNEVRGDYLNSWIAESDSFNSSGAHVEVWAKNWGVYIAELYKKNSSDPDDYYSAEEAQEIVDLQTGGAFTYEQIRNSVVDDDSTGLAADATMSMGESLVSTVTAY